MNDLHMQQCEVCEINTVKLSSSEIEVLISKINDWQLIEENELEKLKKTYLFSDFQRTMEFANRLAELSEKEFHHPDILVKRGGATVIWWSHELGGLHKNDFILAAKTDLLI